jgi:hypothetical protein
MKDKKLRRLSNYWMASGDLELSEEFAQEILDPDLRNMQLDRVSRYAQEMLDMDMMNAEDDIIPPPNYSKKTMADYCLGNVTPFSCEQPDEYTHWQFPVSKPDPDAPFEQPDEYREYTPQQFPWIEDEQEASDHITKNDTVLVMVECVSQFRERYVIEVDADHPEYALDDVAMGRCKEFSQVHLGEVIVSHRVVGVDEVLAICDEDNAYVKSWSDEKKLQVFVTETTYHGDDQ